MKDSYISTFGNWLNEAINLIENSGTLNTEVGYFRKFWIQYHYENSYLAQNEYINLFQSVAIFGKCIY